MLELTLGDYSKELMKEKLLSSKVPFHEIGDTLFIKMEGNGQHYKLLNLQAKINSPRIQFKNRYCRFCGTSLQFYGGIPFKDGFTCYTCANYFLPHGSNKKSFRLLSSDVFVKRAVSLKIFKH